jgi:hypothetical protein
MSTRTRLFTGIAVALLWSVQTAFAQLSPGPLSKVHADLEGISNCTRCHESGKAIGGVQCLTCHVAIKNQLTSGHGFHFAHASRSCVDCHKEHLGINAKITKFDESTFDHVQTGFDLTGAHASLKCEQCHTPRKIRNPDVTRILTLRPHKTYLGLNPRCIDCHEDRHNKTLGATCQSCHDTKSWKPVPSFDHRKTKFALVGKHNDVACVKCHTQSKPGTSTGSIIFSARSFDDCTPCHASPHGRRLSGKTCRSCHAAEGWSTVVSFDHATTQFPLVGKHTAVACVKCHTLMNAGAKGVVSFETRSFTECTPCHATPHNERISARGCKSCHAPDSWKSPKEEQFDHTLTAYALQGKHARVQCARCHKESRGARFADRYLIPFQRCTDCHEDYHNGQFNARYSNDCAACHTVAGFTPTTFSIQRHAETHFSLNGAHIAVPCEQCHTKAGGKGQIFHFANFRCEACHEDYHKGQFKAQMVGHSCAECHSTVKWKAAFFDHSTTRFPLMGKHKTVQCAGCHKERIEAGVKSTLYAGVPLTCQACHTDVHANQFAEKGNTQCASCHSPTGWHFLHFNHETQSTFHLTGAHKNVPCTGCHREERFESRTIIRYKPLASECESCHRGKVK